MTMALKEWIAESVRRSKARGYNPARFLVDWNASPTAATIEKYMTSPTHVQEGFVTMTMKGLLDWSLEQCVLSFPDDFSENARRIAAARLKRSKN